MAPSSPVPIRSTLSTLLLALTAPFATAFAHHVNGHHPAIVPDAVRAIPQGLSSPSDAAVVSVGDNPVVLAALGENGLAWFDADGAEIGRERAVNTELVEVLDGNTLADAPSALAEGALVAIAEGGSGQVSLHRFGGDPLRLERLDVPSLDAGDEVTGLCHTFSPLSRTWQLFVVTDSGEVQQWGLSANAGGAAQRLRSLPAGKGAAHCVVDTARRDLYLVHESLGVWRTGAEPESDPSFTSVAPTAPHGELGEELKGLALVPAGDGAAWLLVSDVEAARIAVIDTADGAVRHAFTVPNLGEAEGLSVAAPDGRVLLAIADEDDGPDSRGVRVLAWDDVASALGLSPAFTPDTLGGLAPVAVQPTVETGPVTHHGDAADDPAIWVHPGDPARSLVLGSDKQGGIHLYDLQGNDLGFTPAGRINNVDLRDGFVLGANEHTLVAGSDRTRHGVALFLLDGAARTLTELTDSFIATDLADPYGLCLYRSERDGSYQVVVNNADDGRALQFLLTDDGQGGIAHELLREIPVGAQAEGCVADDEHGTLFIAEEEHGIWKYSAETADGLDRILVDSFEHDRLVPDVEGLALWKRADGSGYLVASNQGNDSYLLYQRAGDHAYVGEFFIVAGDGIDGASETDGLEVTSAPLGPDYPQGLLVVQDGRNLAPRERQNFKIVPWHAISESLQLD